MDDTNACHEHARSNTSNTEHDLSPLKTILSTTDYNDNIQGVYNITNIIQ